MLILEFNRKDKEVIKSIGDMFTVSLEFELETELKLNQIIQDLAKSNLVNSSTATVAGL